MSEALDGREPKQAPAGAFLFALAFFLFALFLLSQVTSETKFSGVAKLYEKGRLFAKGKLFAEPAFWPLVGVLGMAVFGAFHALSTWRRRAPGGELAEGAFWLRALEYFLWFMIYVQLAPLIGYLLATLIFTAALALRAGYRRRRTIALASLAGLAIVLIFKTLLSVKTPGGAIYEYLPGALRTFMIVNF